jgi:hypothetical protein
MTRSSGAYPYRVSKRKSLLSHGSRGALAIYIPPCRHDLSHENIVRADSLDRGIEHSPLFRLSSARFYFTSRQQAGLFDLNPIVLDQAALGRRRLGEESHASGAEQAFPTVLIFCLVHLQTEISVGIGSP